MRFSRYLLPTLKEIPADAVVPSHILMLRAGMIRRLASGIYTYLPLGLRTIRKIEAIIRREMNRSGALELLMPAVQPSEIWIESGRWSYYGPELLRFQDRREGDFCFGPTHEEVITHLARNEINSYRDLPMNLYQIQTKFRDEIRPRFGLMRGREFIMKDAYSFDLDEEGARKSYWIMHETYERIFSRCGLRYKAVEAGTGAIGGTLSHEFQVLAQTGEDVILSCSSCGYAANQEKADCVQIDTLRTNRGSNAAERELSPLEEVVTPDVKTIEELCAFLNVRQEQTCKTLIFLADGRPVVVMLRGNHELSEAKLSALLKCDELILGDDETIRKITGSPTGFAGPVGLSEEVAVYADFTLEGFTSGVVGANKKDRHLINVAAERDFPDRITYHDLRIALEGETCPRCKKGQYERHRGIEVGQVFYLGTKYSERMNATVLDEKGQTKVLAMGCYGIGVGRTMAAAIEQNHDDKGIIWPFSIAPFQVLICPIGGDAEIQKVSNTLYQSLLDRNIEVLLDDRGERPGVMFNDADLTGIPLRVTIGRRGLQKGEVELKLRAESETVGVGIEDAPSRIEELINEKTK